MGLYEEWKAMTETKDDKGPSDEFWSEYLENEKQNYAAILKEGRKTLKGKLSDLAAEFKMEPAVFTGFLDGINTSLTAELDIDSLELETELDAEIDYEKLYYNMLNAKADWLYNLPEWAGNLTGERRDEIRKDFNRTRIAVSNKVGRNDPCPCGSGKKYKKCCGI